jgi:hypothetical protein
MPKVRISTTVDQSLLEEARSLRRGQTDASVMEAALEALLAAHRAAEIDAAYADAYHRVPLSTPDEWGDLEAWREQAGAS